MNNLINQAYQLDKQDELQVYKQEFYLLPETIYMDGNSLGLLSKRAESSLSKIIESYKKLGVGGWLQGNYPWFYLAEKLGGMVAPFIGALPEEVIMTGSTTVNLHQLIATFYQPSGSRTKILIDEFAFPSDVYALQTQLRLHDLDPNIHLVKVRSRDGALIEEVDIIEAMTDEVMLIVLPTVFYKSGQLLDMERLTQAAHERGILIAFDACHSVGVVPHSFHEQDVDFAFFCGYKYLNGGPGATGGLYVHQKHLNTFPGLAGWFSSNKEKQFDMEHALISAETVGAYQIGTPHILSMAPLIGSLELFAEVGVERLRCKSLQLTQYLMSLVELELNGMGFTIVTPKEDRRRGGHVALSHQDGARICRSLKEQGIIPDFRSPNIVRLAPVPFYTSFTDIARTAETLKQIMITKKYEQFTNQREVVS